MVRNEHGRQCDCKVGKLPRSPGGYWRSGGGRKATRSRQSLTPGRILAPEATVRLVLPGIGQIRADVDRFGAEFGQFRPESAHNRTSLAQNRPKSTPQFGRSLPRYLPRIEQDRPRIGRMKPKVGQRVGQALDPPLTKFGPSSAKFTPSWPGIARFGPEVGQIWIDVSPIWPELGRHIFGPPQKPKQNSGSRCVPPDALTCAPIAASRILWMASRSGTA